MKEITQQEAVALHKTGKQIWMRFSNNTIWSENGHPHLDQYVPVVFGIEPDPRQDDLSTKNGISWAHNVRELESAKQILNYERNHRRRREAGIDESDIVSGVVGYATNSTILGALVGGSVGGALLGDMLNGGTIDD